MTRFAAGLPLCEGECRPQAHRGESEPTPCTQLARDNGYCWTHDPMRAEERALRTRDRLLEQARKLDLDDLRLLVREKEAAGER